MFENNKTIGSYHSDFEKEKGLIEVENVKCSYPPFDQIVLDDLSLVINSGEFVTILGHSGSGKTTLLRSLAGFEIIQEGYIRINGMLASTRWTHLPPEKRKKGFIFQDYALFPHLTVASNLSLGLKELSIGMSNDYQKALSFNATFLRIGTAIFGIIIDNGFTIEFIAIVSIVYIIIEILALFSIKSSV